MNLKGGLSLLGILLQISCNKGNEPAGSRAVNTQDTEATGPYFTLDQKGDAVLCWTERKVGEEPFSLKYAAFNKQAGSFSAVNTVPGSSGINTTAESMGKVAFKADGSLIAVLASHLKTKRAPTPAQYIIPSLWIKVKTGRQ